MMSVKQLNIKEIRPFPLYDFWNSDICQHSITDPRHFLLLSAIDVFIYKWRHLPINENIIGHIGVSKQFGYDVEIRPDSSGAI